MQDILIINGQYPDFTDNTLIEGNVGIKNGKIDYIGNELVESKSVIDAKGQIVSPGFIDIHMHEEDLREGREYCIAKYMLKMGVTTCLGGNCGVLRQPIKEFKDFIKEYGGSPVNYMMLAGYNSIRTKVGVNDYQGATKKQLEEIHDIIRNELNEGAYGISLGLEYSPGIDFEEALSATQVSNDENLMITTHYRKDSVKSLESIKEMIELGKRCNKKMQISHLSSCCAMGQMKEALKIINKAIEDNSKLDFDLYPYAAFSTFIGSAVFDEGCLEEWNKTYSDIMLTEEPYKNIYCTKEIFEEARKNYPQMLAVAFVMNEDEIVMELKNKYGMIASDSIISNGQGHPRAAGTFPRILGKYVREEKVISMVDALQKMTQNPAKRLNLKNKGEIKIGLDADITIFDPNEIIDGADFSSLEIPNRGIEKVFISGELALENGIIINEKLGGFINYNQED